MTGKILGSVIISSMLCLVLLNRPAEARDARFKVVIDPGHGGMDSGAVSSEGICEKDVALDIAQHVWRILRWAGIETVLTRVHDEFVSLNVRSNFINYHNPDVSVSIHANSSRLLSVQGFESYIYNQRFKRGTILFQTAQLSPAYFLNFNFSQKRTYGDSLRTAYYIHRTMVILTGSEDRGIKAAHFSILRKTQVPSVLVEVGFLSHKEEGLLLAQPEYRKAVAESVARGLMQTFYGPEYNLGKEKLYASYRPSKLKKKSHFRFPFAVKGSQ